MSRLRERYEKDVVPALKKEFGYDNVMAIPRSEKVVVNMGLGEATQNAKIVDTGADELARITGQKPVITRAKKSIAQFKVRKGMPVGTMVTLRGERMWEFLDRLICRRAAARPRLPRRVAARLRWPRQLHARPEGPAAVPRDRLHEGGQGARNEHLGGDHRENRRGVAQTAAAARNASSGIRYRLWRRPQRSRKKARLRSTRSGCATAASGAAGREPTCASSRSAASASGSWRSREISPGSTKSSW